MRVCIQMCKDLFIHFVGVSGFVCDHCTRDLRTRLRVCSCQGASDASIMIENGGIRVGPLFPQREGGKNESHAGKHGWCKTLQPLLCD